ncbi:MAG TPA: ParB/RepB/Spo0J family partition protein [Leptolyngbyaceae cyanobacterium]
MPARRNVQKPQLRNVAAILNLEEESVAHSQTAPIETIHLPARQPRRYFSADKLAQLVQSVREHGILEPLLVRPVGDNEYELVAGERRLRAAREVGLEEVPIVVRKFDDQQALQVALVENLQREDLNPLEETEAVVDLLSLTLEASRDDVISLFYQAHNAKHREQELRQNVLSQLEVVEKILSGIGRFTLDSFRSSRLPLLKLPEDVLYVLRQGNLEYTKAQAIARLKDERQRAELLKVAASEDLSLAEIKAKVKALKPTSAPPLETSVIERLNDVSKQLKKSKVWENPKKSERITKLLAELEKLALDS